MQIRISICHISQNSLPLSDESSCVCGDVFSLVAVGMNGHCFSYAGSWQRNSTFSNTSLELLQMHYALPFLIRSQKKSTQKR